MSEENEPEIKTKKEEKKEERQLGKAYLKAQYNYRIGYIFKSIGTFLKHNTVYLIKKHLKIVMLILAALAIIFVVIGINQLVNGSKTSHKVQSYEASNRSLQSQVDDIDIDLKNENKKIDAASISTQSGVKRGKETLDKVFKGMYDYQSSSEYRENRKANMKYFDNPKDKWINDVYSNDKDEDGNSQIESLGLTSELDNTEIYTENVEDTEKKVVPFKVIASYTGDIDDVSSDYATRTHYTIYEVDFDTSDNKITKMKKVNTISENNSIS